MAGAGIIQEDVACKLFYRWYARLGMQTYQIRFHYDSNIVSSDGHSMLGYVSRSHGGVEYDVYVAWTDSFKDLRSIIVHELLHIWLLPVKEIAEEVDDVVRHYISDKNEHAVCQMERYIVNHSKAEWSDTDLQSA